MKKVDGDPDFYRDPITEAVINLNSNEYERYMQAREKKRREREELKNLKNEVSELKSLVRQLLDKHK